MINLWVRVFCSVVALLEAGYSHQAPTAEFQFGGGL